VCSSQSGKVFKGDGELVQLISYSCDVIYSGGRERKRAVLAVWKGVRLCGKGCVEVKSSEFSVGLGACKWSEGRGLER
jgi:hypothetical protein